MGHGKGEIGKKYSIKMSYSVSSILKERRQTVTKWSAGHPQNENSCHGLYN